MRFHIAAWDRSTVHWESPTIHSNVIPLYPVSASTSALTFFCRHCGKGATSQ